MKQISHKDEAEGAHPTAHAPPEGSSSNRDEHTRSTPLPWGQLSILCVVLLTESICSTVLIPFVPTFIAYIKGWDVDSSGYAAGFPVGLFMLGQVISGKMWGSVSDTIGRKLSISIGVFGCAVCMLLFGLSGSVLTMCFWRFLHGISAGCSIVAKTMINDLTDRSNRAKGLALVSLTWGIGTLFGPAVGGYLYDPAHSSTLAFLHLSPTGLLGSHPAFLPSAVVALYNIFAVVISVLYLRESNPAARPLREVLPPALVKMLHPVINIIQPKLPCDMATEVTVTATDDHKSGGGAACGPASSTLEATPAVSSAAAPPQHTSFGFRQAFQNPLLRRVCVIAMLISSSDMIFAQIFPLWLAADTANGGLHLDPSTMANLVLVNSAPAVAANIVFAKAIELTGSPIRLWIGSQLGYGLLTAVMPIATSMGSRAGFWYTMVIGMLRKVTECWSFGLIMVLVSLTAPPGKVGIMFGIQQSTGCMVRCVVPFIFAPLFAWSIENHHPFPFNQYLVFLISVIPLGLGAYMAARVYVPNENDEEGGGEDSDMMEGGDSFVARRSGLGSARDSVRSRYSFFGSVTGGEVQERESLLNNSFVNLANSFATNIMPGVVQNTILAVPVGAALQINEEEIEVAGQLRNRDGQDSRENSSQEDDNVDDDAEYASVKDEMQVIAPTARAGDIEGEDVRIAERHERYVDEELPI